MTFSLSRCARTALALCLLAPALARAEIKERIAAVVNGQPVLLSEVDERVQYEVQHLTSAGPARQQEVLELEKKGLEQLIDEKLIEAEAVNLGVEVTDDEVTRQADALAHQNGMDLEAFKTALAGQGISFQLVKDSLRRQALQFKLLQYKVKPRKVSDEEVQAAYAAQYGETDTEIRVRNLFVQLAAGATPAQEAAARAKLAKAQARLQAGEEFALVARDLSDAPTAHEGGDLGWMRKGTLFPDAEAALFKLPAGGMTNVIQTPAGFFLFKVADRREVAKRPIAEVQEEIRQRLANDSIMKERDNYMQSLRKGAQIDTKL
ncbi:MAG: peptidylprolyl isomerase [Deltaproteobacteria bacterium]|nr:peptidylprolyl isomerase [Deltaproteobacteria bacterium]